eukprot:scaffold66_cov390-Prasinococcus_capsulatus_cf.AAC.3
MTSYISRRTPRAASEQRSPISTSDGKAGSSLPVTVEATARQRVLEISLVSAGSRTPYLRNPLSGAAQVQCMRSAHVHEIFATRVSCQRIYKLATSPTLRREPTSPAAIVEELQNNKTNPHMNREGCSAHLPFWRCLQLSNDAGAQAHLHVPHVVVPLLCIYKAGLHEVLQHAPALRRAQGSREELSVCEVSLPQPVFNKQQESGRVYHHMLPRVHPLNLGKGPGF